MRRQSWSDRLAVLVLTILLLLPGCPGTRKTLVPSLPSDGDARVLSQFVSAKARFLKDGRTTEFKRIVKDYPNDPIAPWAMLYAGIEALHTREFAQADEYLTRAIEVTTSSNSNHRDIEYIQLRAQLFLGITKNYEGDHVAASRLLVPTERMAESEDERTDWLAAAAFSFAAGDNPEVSLSFFDQWWARANGVERAVILARVEEVVALMTPAVLHRQFDELEDRKGPSIATVGSRLVLMLEESGQSGDAAPMREIVARIRAALGMSRMFTFGPVSSGVGTAGMLGAVLPLGSKTESRIAELAVEGLGIAAGATDGNGVAAIELRAGVDTTTAVQGIADLAQRNAIAVIGQLDSGSINAAAAAAGAAGIVLITMAVQPEGHTSSRIVFHIRHSAESRARTLARRALAKGIRTFAVFAPDSKYGNTVADAFVAVIESFRGKVVTSLRYAVQKNGKIVSHSLDKSTGAKTYLEQSTSLGDGWDAIFVPDNFENLELIAPSLHSAGAISRPFPFEKSWDTKKRGGRQVQLLSTAEALTSEYLSAAGRHSQGALFAPGYYADDTDPSGKPFIERYRAAYGKLPGVVAAYAYDAAQVIAAAGHVGRAGLASTLSGVQLSGVTGTIQFDRNQLRADDGLVYTLIEETNGLAIRIAH
ncbi:MAG: Extracellular ligand-binding receptor [Myxococcales bacterium]|nr:Extracellular ligand-binding receptor [Myxococcales bacterium]